MAKIIITGGAGFIGSELSKRLVECGKEVIIIDNLSYGHLDNIPRELYGNFICMDVRDKKIERYISKGDTVFHFAGIAPLPDCQIDPKEAFDVNVGGVGNILDCIRKVGGSRIIFSSTSAIYENSTKFPCKESDELTIPTLTYPLTKYAAENLIISYNKCFSIPYTILRFFNVYGPHQDFRRKHPPFIGYILKCILNNETPTFFSDGNHRRDYVFSEDLVDLCQKLIKDKQSVNQIFNVASGKVYSVKDIYGILQKSTGVNLPEPIYSNPKKFWDKHEDLFGGYYKMDRKVIELEVKKYASGNPSKAKKILGWSASTTMEEGIRRCYEYCLNTTL